VVIFSNLRLTADSLAHQLKREGMTCRHLHGKLDQDRGRMCVVGLVVSSVF
jgi:superfamily II DNA/RNA helicase